MSAALVVLAKAPLAGRSKTRLCPPCTPPQAAALAEAALADTLTAVAATGVGDLVLALDGRPGDWVPEGFRVVPQARGGLGARIAAGLGAAGGHALLVGMDTPQVTPSLLIDSVSALDRPGVDAVLGPAVDGGYWAIGFRRAQPGAFTGVPMSTATTVAAQRRRLRELGLRHVELPLLRDVDTFADAEAVATACPASRFARAVALFAAAA